MLRHVALVRTDVSEELRAAIIRMTISELGKYSYGYISSSPILVTLMVEALSSSETSAYKSHTA
jgi:hypothetical protein